MKKFKEFMLSLIIPHRMVRFQDMSLLVAILLLLIGVILSGFSNINRMNYFTSKTFQKSDYSLIIEEQIGLDEIKLEISKDNIAKFDLPENSDGIFVKRLKDENGVNFHVTIVVDTINKDNNEELSNEDLSNERTLSNFDIQDYRNYYINTREENTVYLLYVLTETTIFHLYDLGQKFENGEYVDASTVYIMHKTVTDEDAGFFKKLTGQQSKNQTLYFLPSDESELVASQFDNSNYQYASSNWTRIAREGEETQLNGVTYYATAKLGYYDETSEEEKEHKTVNAILRVGYTYDKVESSDYKASVISSSLKEFIVGYYNGIVNFDSELYSFIISIISFFIFLFVPPFFSLFAWLFTRKTGMPKYKNYLNIMSIIQIPAALIMFFSGWFVNLLDHLWIIIIVLLMMIWYYIFVIFKINSKLSSNIYDDYNNSHKEEKKQEETKPTFRKLNDDSSVIG